MTHAVREVRGRIQYVSHWEGKTAKDVRRALEKVVERNGEGLVIKHPLAKYILNGRNSDWIKVKPDYMVRARPAHELTALIMTRRW